MEKLFNYEGNEVFVMSSENQYLFKAKDLAEVLDYYRSDKALKILDDDEKMLIPLRGETGQARNTWFVTESGLYHLIITSSKPKAKEFRKWITSEVLPSIRKAGSYQPDQVSQKQANLEEVKLKLDAKKKLVNARKSDLHELEKEIKKLEKEFWSIFKSDPAQMQLYPKEVMDELKQ